jgi:hypothetical protein
MDFRFNSESVLFKIAVFNFVALAISQFFILPFLGYKIYNRCKEIGYEMKSRPAFALFNTSNLWSEARKFNQKENDEIIKKALTNYRYFWIYALMSFAFIVAASFLNR